MRDLHPTRDPVLLTSKRKIHILLTSEHEVRVSGPKHETRVLPASGHESHIFGPKRETRILRQTQLTSDTRVSTSKCENNIFNSKRDGCVST